MKNSGTGFIRNVGQVYDYNKQLVPFVLYNFNADNSSVFLTEHGLTYSLIERELVKEDERLAGNPKGRLNYIDKNVARLDIDLIGANIKKENIIETEYANDVAINYYGGGLKEDALNRRACKQIIIKDIYPQIDWVLKITDDQMFKYDFVVHPGGNPNDIKENYKGATKLLLDETKKTLTAITPLGNIVDGKLYCYTQEDGKTVNANYNLTNETLNLNVDQYDNQKTLIVDPLVYMSLTWSTFYGGGSVGGGGGTTLNSIKTDDVNNRVYVVGYCYSSPFPNFNNGTAYYFSPGAAGSTIEAIISAFDLAGVQKWATYYMSTEYDAAFDVTIDGLGNIYMVGITEWHGGAAVNFLTQQYSGGFIQAVNNATPIIPGVYEYQEGFIVRFNKLGVLQWATLFGGNKQDQLYSVSCDASNNVLICGITRSTASIPVQNAGGYYQSTLSGGGDNGLIAMFNVNTAKKWTTYFGNSGTEAHDIDCDASNNIYVSGVIGNNVGFPFVNAPGGYNQTTSGYFLSAFTAVTAQKWCTSFEPGQYISDINVNRNDGTILLGGFTVSTTPSSYWLYPSNGAGGAYPTYWDNSYNGGSYDGFVTLIDPTYKRLWATLLGGNADDRVTAVSISKNGRMFVAGYTDNSSNPLTGTFPTVNPGGSAYFESNVSLYKPLEMFISYFEAKAGSVSPTVSPYNLSWSTLFGDNNSGQEAPYDIDISGKYLFLCGSAFQEPNTPSFPLINELGGFLQTNTNPIVGGFSQSNSNGIILKFLNEGGFNLKEGVTFSNENFTIYPNPTDVNFINIQVKQNTVQFLSFEVIDICGRILKSIDNAEISNGLMKVDLNGLKAGYYFINCKSSTINSRIPFIKL